VACLVRAKREAYWRDRFNAAPKQMMPWMVRDLALEGSPAASGASWLSLVVATLVAMGGRGRMGHPNIRAVRSGNHTRRTLADATAKAGGLVVAGSNPAAPTKSRTRDAFLSVSCASSGW